MACSELLKSLEKDEKKGGESHVYPGNGCRVWYFWVFSPHLLCYLFRPFVHHVWCLMLHLALRLSAVSRFPLVVDFERYLWVKENNFKALCIALEAHAWMKVQPWELGRNGANCECVHSIRNFPQISGISWRSSFLCPHHWIVKRWEASQLNKSLSHRFPAHPHFPQEPFCALCRLWHCVGQGHQRVWHLPHLSTLLPQSAAQAAKPGYLLPWGGGKIPSSPAPVGFNLRSGLRREYKSFLLLFY